MGRDGAGARATALASVVLALAACTAEPVATRPSPAPPPAPAPPSETAPEPAERPRPITLALAGDVHFEGALRARLADPATALRPATAALAAADVAVVNLETSIGPGGRPEPGKRFPFQAPPSALRALARAGVDVASMANNHVLDFGREPLPALFDAARDAAQARPPLQVVGVGRDADAAFAPALVEVGGTRVAVLAATIADADPTADPTGAWAAGADRAGTADAMDPARLLRAVRTARAEADVVVAYLHWGVQGETCPSPDQTGLARAVVRAGADVVAGGHAHLLQGAGRLGPGFVAYGLGNFAWYTDDPPSSLTGTLTLTVRPRAGERARVTRARWTPAVIGADGLPRPVTDAAAEPVRAQLARGQACSGLTPVG